ncbi:MAG: hypothetical protein OXJ64_00505, partial [Boseongicola sp.]|nr:hypothetical protein [Boseongicola sp.]
MENVGVLSSVKGADGNHEKHLGLRTRLMRLEGTVITALLVCSPINRTTDTCEWRRAACSGRIETIP